jgi:oligopeptide/dipeptide ABC transporter ATP-binding protein
MRDIQYREGISTAEKDRRAAAMLGRVGLPDPEAKLRTYPHELSGGMRQRVAIAMATLMHPKLLIADEPTTALDATLEVQIIALLQAIQAEIGCAILFISHHLGVIAELCDRVVVMYAGETVEEGPVADIFERPAHPYTHKLIECDPGRLKTRAETLPSIPGSLPDLTDPPAGCIFRDRCDLATDLCARQRPPRRSVTPGRWSACHHAEKVTP